MIVTVLTPTLNAARHLADCLGSIAEQTYPREQIQHLVLDGESTDATVAMAREAGAEVDVRKDVSLYDAMNRGIRLARGEVVGWLNADDTYETDAIEQVAEAFRRNPGADMVVGHLRIERPGSSEVVRTRADALARARAGKPGGAWIPPIAVFYRLATLRSLGEYEPRYRIAGDLDLWLRTAARSPLPHVVHTGALLGTFRMHEGSLSSGDDPERSLAERIEIAERNVADASRPPGVRRTALASLRGDLFYRMRWRHRAEPVPARVRAALACYRDLRRFGPGTLQDVRGQLPTMLAELARAALVGPR
jgi:glycosyltransferase involved in cell wall biosynthesis